MFICSKNKLYLGRKPKPTLRSEGRGGEDYQHGHRSTKCVQNQIEGNEIDQTISDVATSQGHIVLDKRSKSFKLKRQNRQSLSSQIVWEHKELEATEIKQPVATQEENISPDSILTTTTHTSRSFTIDQGNRNTLCSRAKMINNCRKNNQSDPTNQEEVQQKTMHVLESTVSLLSSSIIMENSET